MKKSVSVLQKLDLLLLSHILSVRDSITWSFSTRKMPDTKSTVALLHAYEGIFSPKHDLC